MTERLIWDDYEIRGEPYEVWADGNGGWYLVDPRTRTVTEYTDFKPHLSDAEVQKIADAVFDWYSD
jgi:hypothetical protein